MQKEQKTERNFPELQTLELDYQPVNEFATQLVQRLAVVDQHQMKTLQEKYHYFLIKIHKYLSEHSKLKIDYEKLNQTIHESQSVSRETKNILFVILGNFHIKNKTEAVSSRVEKLKQINREHKLQILQYRQKLDDLKKNYFLLSQRLQIMICQIQTKQKQQKIQKASCLFENVKKDKLRKRFLIKKLQQNSILKQNTNSTYIQNSHISNLRKSMSRLDSSKLHLKTQQRIYTSFNSIHTSTGPFSFVNYANTNNNFLPILSKDLTSNQTKTNWNNFDGCQKQSEKQQFRNLAPEEIIKQILQKGKLKQISQLIKQHF